MPKIESSTAADATLQTSGLAKWPNVDITYVPAPQAPVHLSNIEGNSAHSENITAALKAASKDAPPDGSAVVKHAGELFNVPVEFAGRPYFNNPSTGKRHDLSFTRLPLPNELVLKILRHVPDKRQRTAGMILMKMSVSGLLRSDGSALLLAEGSSSALSDNESDRALRTAEEKEAMLARHLGSIAYQMHAAERSPQVLVHWYSGGQPETVREQAEILFGLPWHRLHVADAEHMLSKDEQGKLLRQFDEALSKLQPAAKAVALLALSHHVFTALPSFAGTFIEMLKTYQAQESGVWRTYRESEPTLTEAQRTERTPPHTMDPRGFMAVTAALHNVGKIQSAEDQRALIDLAFVQLHGEFDMLMDENGQALSVRGLDFLTQLTRAIPYLKTIGMQKQVLTYLLDRLADARAGHFMMSPPQQQSVMLTLLQQIPPLLRMEAMQARSSTINWLLAPLQDTQAYGIFRFGLRELSQRSVPDALPLWQPLIKALPYLSAEERRELMDGYQGERGWIRGFSANGANRSLEHIVNSLTEGDAQTAVTLYTQLLQIAGELVTGLDVLQPRGLTDLSESSRPIAINASLRILGLTKDSSTLNTHGTQEFLAKIKVSEQRLLLWQALLSKLSQIGVEKPLQKEEKDAVIQSLQLEVQNYHPDAEAQTVRARLLSMLDGTQFDATFRDDLLRAIG